MINATLNIKNQNFTHVGDTIEIFQKLFGYYGQKLFENYKVDDDLNREKICIWVETSDFDDSQIQIRIVTNGNLNCKLHSAFIIYNYRSKKINIEYKEKATDEKLVKFTPCFNVNTYHDRIILDAIDNLLNKTAISDYDNLDDDEIEELHDYIRSEFENEISSLALSDILDLNGKYFFDIPYRTSGEHNTGIFKKNFCVTGLIEFELTTNELKTGCILEVRTFDFE